MTSTTLADKKLPDGAHLLTLARDRSLAGREALASSVAAMVSSRDQEFSAEEEALANDILRKLIDDVERSVRQALAANLAGSSAAPRDVILALANDEIEIAFPVLAESPLLEDDELAEIVQKKDSGHRIAIAMRPGLSERVSGDLVASGDREAIVCLLHNNDATIAEGDMASLVDAANGELAYQSPLAGRTDLSPGLALKLASFVSDILRDSLISAYDLDVMAVRKAAASAAADAAATLAGRDIPQSTEEHVTAKRREVRNMIDILRRHEWPHFEAAMVRFAGLPAALTHSILSERDGRRLTVLCRASGVDKSDFAPLFLLSRKATPDVEVVDAADMRDALALFDSIDRSAASRVVARWRVEFATKSRRRFGPPV